MAARHVISARGRARWRHATKNPVTPATVSRRWRHRYWPDDRRGPVLSSLSLVVASRTAHLTRDPSYSGSHPRSRSSVSKTRTFE